MQDFWKLFLLFVIFSFVGWIAEVIVCSHAAKKFINRGFLNGPFCPIYGVGAVLIIGLLSPIKDNLIFLFLMCIILAGLLEYATGFMLERLFHAKYWDYSDKKFNIAGRVCLSNLIAFGVGGVLLVILFYPILLGFINLIPASILPYIGGGLLVYFLIDWTVSSIGALKLNKRLADLQKIIDDINKKVQSETTDFWHAALDRLDDNMAIKALEEARKKAEKGFFRPIQRRIIKAFPNMKSTKNNESLQHIKSRMQSQSKSKIKSRANKKSNAKK